jgi:ParB-like chromosome segregation protein Spo0J
MRLRIAYVLATSPVEPTRHLDPARVEEYRRVVDELPPVVVFDTEEGLLLADGYHRVAAALLEGRDEIEADIRKGSRHDALEFAALLAATQRGISVEAARRQVEKWSTNRPPEA